MSRDLGVDFGAGPLLGGRSPEPCASSPPVSYGDYAPSPNTSSQALHRANQLRVQNLLRRLLVEPEESVRIDTLRLLRRTLREIDYQLGWLTQVDFLETIERLLSGEQQASADGAAQPANTGNGPDASWRLVHDATQLLIESVGRLEHEIDQQLIEAIVPSVVENLGHQRSEVRRASLLLLNLLLNEEPKYFKLLMRLFIDYGLTNYRNRQAQRGAILSLPLLISEPIVARGEDLTPLIRCLSELLLIDSNEQLFYSLFLAMQRIHLMLGDAQFQSALRHCEPEAVHLYRQAASRNNSLVATNSIGETNDPLGNSVRAQKSQANKGGPGEQVDEGESGEERAARQQQARQHVTFERNFDQDPNGTPPKSSDTAPDVGPADQAAKQPVEDGERHRSESQLSATTSESLSIGSSKAGSGRAPAAPDGAARPPARQFSSDVSSTCSSDAHLVNPAHYMTKAALEGHPLERYEEIHRVDHSNVTGLAINDFGPICNTPTVEFVPQLSAGVQASLGQHLRANQQCESPAAALTMLSSELKFGIFPRHLIQATLHSARAADRYEAIQELMCIVRESPVNHLAILMTYFDSFLEQFLAKVLLGARQRQQQTDCKLELVAVDMIETIIVKTKVSTMQFIRPIVSLLMRALATEAQHGDQQQPSIFRENTCRVLHKMMAYLPPQHVIDAVFEHKHQKSAAVREEAINRVTAAILEYDRNEFNLTKLCYHVLPMLADQSASVRLASLECIATLAHVLGPERIGSLLTAAEAVQTGCDYDGLLDAINARLLRHTLPRCQSNGIVRYALKPFLAHHQLQASASGGAATLAADVRWVLESPSLHHHLEHEFADQQRQLYGQHQHHRVGVYSPPSLEERRCRKGSVAAALIDSNNDTAAEHQNHRHHHHHHHHQKTAVRRSMSTSSGLQQADLPFARSPPEDQKHNSDQRAREADKSTELDISESHRGHAQDEEGRDAAQAEVAAASRRKSQAGELAASGRRRESVAASGALQSREQVANEKSLQSRKPSAQERRRPQLPSQAQQQQPMRRSNSQDSLSSTDTNKVLFQFYLGKFKQSLADSSGNQYQADSIIYTDINQAYELSRHQSRFQQTSLERADSLERNRAAGRHGDASAAVAPHDSHLSKTADGKQEAKREANRKRASMARMGSNSGDGGGGSSSQEAADESAGANRRPSQRHARRESLSMATRRQQERDEPNETSGSESPQTVREVHLGSQRTNSKTRPSVQRQTTVGRVGSRESAEHHQQAQNSFEAPQAAAAGQKRASATSNGSGSRQQSLAGPTNEGGPERGVEVAEEKAAPGESAESHRRRSQSISKQSSGGSHTSRSNHEQRSSGRGGSSGSQAQLARQESEATTISSLAASSLSSGGLDMELDKTGAQVRGRREGEQAEDERRSHRRRVRSRPRTGEEETQSGQSSEQREARRRASRSQPPVARARDSAEEPHDARQFHQHSHHQQEPHSGGDHPKAARLIRVRHQSNYSDHHQLRGLGSDAGRASSVSPGLSNSINIRHILENVAELEGPFAEPQLALKVAMSALDSACWSTKVEGLLALIRLAAHHPELMLAESHLHEIIGRTADETRNLRSTVARAAIFALGDFCARLKRSIEPEMDVIVKALLTKSIENTSFIRDDIRRALGSMVEHLTPWRLATLLINQGAQHKSSHVRRMTSQFVAQVVDRLGAAKALVGAREISHLLLPAAARFAQDQSPHTRYYGRVILSKLVHHNSFERLLRRNLASTLYRSTIGTIESIKRRGCGAPPEDA